MEEPTFSIKKSVMEAIIQELVEALEPKVKYKLDGFDLGEEAHKIKNKKIENALYLLPSDIVNPIRNKYMIEK